jgi:tetratricopeptide (TPR) repeat protein
LKIASQQIARIPSMRFGSNKIEGPLEIENVNALKQACEEFRRSDLYEALSWIIILRPHWADENLEAYLKDKRYIIVANAMLYESKLEQAKEYFEKALGSAPPDSAYYHQLSIVLANLEIVSKIAQRSWELDGKLTTEP